MNVIHEIADERIHQQQDKGWTSEHDDTLTEGQLADAAVAYITGNKKLYPRGWMYKQSTKRRQLIKAAALIVAEIERLDRRMNDEQVNDSNHVHELVKQQDYPQDQEANEYRYISPAWLDAIAEGLTKGAVKHPGETWRQIPADEHLARALRHINLYRMGDRSEPHIINASMRIMMAFETAGETDHE